jgi:predicted O-methyltransferase YrrM
MNNEIQGFMPPAGLDLLRQLAAGRCVIEVGVWKGRTALAMAETAIEVWAIDHFRGDRYTGAANTLPECWANLRGHAAGDKVRLIAARWEDVWPAIDLRDFDLLFYDGDHDYEPTAMWLSDALYRARPDATIVVDDYSSRYPQVMQAVAECLTGCQRRLRIEGALCILEPIG